MASTTRPVDIEASSPLDIDRLIAPHMEAAVDVLAGPAPLLAGMGRYHLGWVDREFRPVAADAIDRGKRVRPSIAMLCCAAAGGRPEDAAPLAAAIELLHNFTLIHDDIQDHSPARRHRATVWTLWGAAQAINAGDALFAAAHLALFRLRQAGVPAELVLDLADAFDRMTIEIVAGQVLDLSFESRSDVAPADYLEMIAGKTAAIVRYAAWAGALLGGASPETADRFGAFGLALGLGFQVQDDLLGIWGSMAETGKAAADDIRRKKQSYPILLLRAAADDETGAELDRIYDREEIEPAAIGSVLALLDRYGIRGRVERLVRQYHDDAGRALEAAAHIDNPARRALLDRVEALASRSS
ncbi:MAG: polyprenyl synthetase family protein [Thermomicrobiales bacterium]|nr:polyprenyl synthetase family protein [Thermomicrobiales bacterium]